MQHDVTGPFLFRSKQRFVEATASWALHGAAESGRMGGRAAAECRQKGGRTGREQWQNKGRVSGRNEKTCGRMVAEWRQKGGVKESGCAHDRQVTATAPDTPTTRARRRPLLLLPQLLPPPLPIDRPPVSPSADAAAAAWRRPAPTERHHSVPWTAAATMAARRALVATGARPEPSRAGRRRSPVRMTNHPADAGGMDGPRAQWRSSRPSWAP